MGFPSRLLYVERTSLEKPLGIEQDKDQKPRLTQLSHGAG